MERHHNLVDTDEKYNRCEHLGDNNKSQKSSLAFEFHSGQGISSWDTADHSQKSGASCDHNGVHHVIAHGSQLPSVKLDQMASTGKIVPFMEKISARLLRAVHTVTKYGYKVIRQMAMITT